MAFAREISFPRCSFSESSLNARVLAFILSTLKSLYVSLFPSGLFFLFPLESIPPLSNNNEGKFAGLMGNDSEWYFTGAKLFPNVKGCGYPPILNCSIFYRLYANIGQNFSCYYSKVDPGIVISDLDMWQVSGVIVYTFHAWTFLSRVYVSLCISVFNLKYGMYKSLRNAMASVSLTWL